MVVRQWCALVKVHQRVAESVKDIFNRHKARFGYADDETLSLVSAADAKKQATTPKTSSQKKTS